MQMICIGECGSFNPLLLQDLTGHMLCLLHKQTAFHVRLYGTIHFPILFLVSAGFDMRPVYKYSARIYISAVYRFLKIFLKDSFKNLRFLKPSRIIFTEC